MLNKAPIFINGFSRGGSNIVVNLLLSHPDVCSPTGETQQVFKGGARFDSPAQRLRKRVFYFTPLSLMTFERFLAQSNLNERRPLSAWSRRYIDWIFYREKVAADHEWHNRFISEGVEYQIEEIKRARLLSKNLNGLVFLTENLAAMYPDATFFGLIRNGLAVCEGHVRRGRSPEDAARLYNAVANKILDDVKALKNYHLIRFEHVMADPVGYMRRLHEQASLDAGKVEKIRLQMKPVLSKSGHHRLSGGTDREVVWYDLESVKCHFHPDIDAVQIANLSNQDRNKFLAVAGGTMERLGYL